MAKVFFVADTHLDWRRPRRTALFLSFLDTVRAEGGDLYILGDLFDYWANNRVVFRRNHEVLEAIRCLTQVGQRVALLFGNRDLLLRERYLGRYGIRFLGETATVVEQDLTIFLAHGHTLCADDIQFQNYRRRTWPLYRALDRVLPGSIENHLAERFIFESKMAIEAQGQSRFQLSETSIRRRFDEGAHAVICGHSHRADHTVYEGGKLLFVLPAWSDKQGGYLVLNEGRFAPAVFG
jgi:UDP-2,3-diacylglucosamine hydrolase